MKQDDRVSLIDGTLLKKIDRRRQRIFVAILARGLVYTDEDEGWRVTRFIVNTWRYYDDYYLVRIKVLPFPSCPPLVVNYVNTNKAKMGRVYSTTILSQITAGYHACMSIQDVSTLLQYIMWDLCGLVYMTWYRYTYKCKKV